MVAPALSRHFSLLPQYYINIKYIGGYYIWWLHDLQDESYTILPFLLLSVLDDCYSLSRPGNLDFHEVSISSIV